MTDGSLTADKPEPGSINIKATLIPKVNLAQQQNAVPLFHGIELVNESDRPIDDLDISVEADPAFLTPRTWHVDRIGAGGRFRPADIDAPLSRPFLASLDEAVLGSVTVSVAHAGERIAESIHAVEVLAADEWGGIGYFPEMTAAFCRPNDTAVERILKRAADILRDAGKDASLEGYQSGDRDRTWNLISAMHIAAASFGIDYANPPASFEQTGQKVRSPGRILDTGLGTCLDLALLFASCLEQCGLNPLVLLKQGHAFAGCWLVDEDFSVAAVDDAQAIRKRVKLGEMILHESTLLTRRPAPGLSHAAEAGLAHLDDEDEFEWAIDVRRARMQAIRPVMEGDGQEAVALEAEAPEEVVQPLQVEDAPPLPDLDFTPTREEKPDSPEGRIGRWKRRLLDLTLRNNLLNFKPTRRAVPIFCADPAALEDVLADGQKLKFVPMPEIMEGDDPRSASIHQSRHGYEAKAMHAEEALGRKELLVELPEKEMNGRLVDLFRKAWNDIEEGGTNTLFLAVGFLRWTHAEHPERMLKAPLLLLPAAIERASVRSGFRLVLHDDDLRINPTLLEMLLQDHQITIPELADDLPRDHSGLDVPLIWQTFRKHIRDIKGWEIVEEAHIATFSFTKYLMWRDLEDRAAQLKENPVVKHLIDTPRDPYRNQDAFPDPAALDEHRAPQRTFCPLMADSSQLAAVFAAAEGRDFVLVGPPGTGKSQTITNMIVQCLAEAKTVLFVSEKMAALDVVNRRLRQVGLGTFCLELHSSKARKLDVLQQMGAAWEAAGAAEPGEWQDEANRLAGLRDQLNRFPRHLHRVYRNGLTPFQAFSHVIGNRDQPRVDVTWPSSDTHGKEELEGLDDLIGRLAINAREVGSIAENPFAAVGNAEWSPSWQGDFEAAARVVSSAIDPVSSAMEAFLAASTLASGPRDADLTAAMAELADLLPSAAGRSYAFAVEGEALRISESLDRLAGHGWDWSAKKDALSREYRREATSLDLDRLEGTWKAAGETWWPLSMFKRGGVAKKLGDVAASGQKPSKDKIADDLTILKAMREAEQAIDGLAEDGARLGAAWKGLDSDWNALARAAAWGRRVSGCVSRLAGSDLNALLALREKLGRLLSEGNDLLAETGPVGGKAKSLAAAWTALAEGMTAVRNVAVAAEGETFTDAPDWLTGLSELANTWLANLPRLHGWCAWCKARGEARSVGLAPFVDALEAGTIGPGALSAAFDFNYRRWWIDRIVDEDAVLREFISAEHERRIGEFQDLDERFMDLTKRYARARLSGNVPSKSSVAGKNRTEWGILNRELTKKSRHMPLRKLVASLPNALTKLTPCLLMSPLSIAQYLTAGTVSFDVVIFDEASQIPVWDAIGAIARGRQTIVVGDPKQLPPTSFFSRNEAEEDDDVEVEDLESILDECMGANLPTRHLDWHYRSRHESLIAFSNHRYYQGRLITFPSAVTEDVAVRFHAVADGVYEKAGARVNREEARIVAESVVDRLKNPEFNRNGWTLGVVTFNQQQQVLIEDMLDDARHQDPDLEKHFSADAIEPVFVKNLENVQGDERDIILFSITFGPDSSGRVSMNFGPLNKSGGERRLNVAITRARRGLHVYGALRSEHIDLSRTQALGVRDFKHFLEYAEMGSGTLGEAVGGVDEGFDPGFEETVTRALGDLGWTVQPRVGVSGFRIDLGVVHPDHPGRFVAGVECDGTAYRRASTAKDRDKLREYVLRGLGWSIIRVWSTDWWIDPQGSADKLDSRLRAILETDRNGATEETESKKIPEPQIEETATQPAGKAADNLYRISDPASVVDTIDPERFNDPSETGTIAAMVSHVVDMEGPVALDLLAARIARVYGFKRTGPRILSRITGIALAEFQATDEEHQTFLWPHGIDPDTYADFRVVPPGDEPPRKAEQVCLLELANLARHVRDRDFPLDDRELARGMGERLGYTRLAAKLEARLLAAASTVD
jgi:hypothetical protein